MDPLSNGQRTHLCVLKPEYLGLILCETKTIECRLTKIPCPPYGRVEPGDRILLKQSSGPIRGEAMVERVMYYHPVTVRLLRRLRKQYNTRICGRPDFWASRRNHHYGTLIWLRQVKPIWPPRTIAKTDARGWVVLNNGIAG